VRLDTARLSKNAPSMIGRAADLEPPWGIEPQTYALREARHAAPGALPAQIAAHGPRNAPGAQSADDSRSTTRSTRPASPQVTECYFGCSVARTDHFDGREPRRRSVNPSGRYYLKPPALIIDSGHYDPHQPSSPPSAAFSRWATDHPGVRSSSRWQPEAMGVAWQQFQAQFVNRAVLRARPRAA
jgi:hypothetical protein